MGWSNTASSVLTANTVIITANGPNTGIFVYSGTPAAGNLIGSWTAAAGTDPFGNTFGAGIEIFGTTVSSLLHNRRNIEMTDGQILFTAVGANPSASPAILEINPDTGNLIIFGGIDGLGGTLNPVMSFLSGGFGATRARITVTENSGTRPADWLVSGAVLHSSLTGTASTWQTPSYSTGWSSTVSFDGLGGGEGLRFRLMAEDDVWWYGLATTAAGATTQFATVPAGFFSATHTTYGMALRNRAGTVAPVGVAISTAGMAFITDSPSAGDEYLFNTRLPLENVP